MRHDNETGTGRHRVTLLMRSLAGATILLPAAFASAQSGGLALPENGGPINGTAQAGSAAVARDAETAWLNPAGIMRLEKAEILVAVQPFLLDFEFNPSSGTTVPGTDGGNQGGWFPSGGVFLAVPLHERVGIGFSITSPAGLALEPDAEWVGRYFMTKTQLVVLNFEPSIAVRITDQWSIGGGVDVQYARFEQNIAVNRPGPLSDGAVALDGDSWDVGFSIGVLWEPLDTTRVGVRYRSEVDHQLSGDLTAFRSTPVSTSLNIPQSVTLSAYHDFTESFALMLDVGWQNWSAFDKTVISLDGFNDTQVELPRNFRDTWTVSLGTHIRPADKWLVMAGAGYTSSAVSDENRTPDLPVDQQVRASVGLEYEINDTWRLGANYTYLWLGENSIDAALNPSTGRVVGDYDANAHLFGIYFSARF